MCLVPCATRLYKNRDLLYSWVAGDSRALLECLEVWACKGLRFRASGFGLSDWG